MQQAPAKKKEKIKVTRVVNGIETMVEIEVDDVAGPGWGPNDKHTLLNHHLRRVDGPIKVSGVAEYTFDKRAPGMLYARVLRSPHAHARVLKIDSSAARGIPGVRAIVSVTDEQVVKGSNKAITEADKKNPTDIGTAKAAPAPMVNFAGEPVAAVAADTAEIAADAIQAIKVEYEVLPHVVIAEDAMKDGAPKVYPEGNLEPKDKRGDLAKTEEALSKAEVSIEAEYRTPILHHSSLETHGHMVDYRGGDTATVYASTQGTFTIPGDAAKELGLPESSVTEIVENMGGGFGSKFGIGDGSQAGQPYIYRVKESAREVYALHTNEDASRAMRAPGHPQASFAIESLMDELAYKIGMDPVAFRKKNLADTVYHRQLDRGAREIGWERRNPVPGGNPGVRRRGFGCAVGTWGGGGGPQCKVDVSVARDGSVIVAVGTQDLGTGTRTYTRAIVAEELGLQQQ